MLLCGRWTAGVSPSNVTALAIKNFYVELRLEIILGPPEIPGQLLFRRCSEQLVNLVFLNHVSTWFETCLQSRRHAEENTTHSGPVSDAPWTPKSV